MIFEIGKTSADTKVMSDDGKPIKGVSAITIHAEAGQPTSAKVELIFIEETRVKSDVRKFYVGGYDNVVGLVLDNGEIVNLLEPSDGAS